MGMALYSLLLVVGLAVCSPWWLARMVRYRDGMGQRLGRVPAELRAVAAGRQVVWVHAVSVGEVLAATRLVRELEEKLGDGWVVVVSTTTATGQALAKERFGAGSPSGDSGRVECGRAGVPVAVVNARVSDRSYALGLRARAVWGRVLRRVDLFLAQSEEDARRLVAMGARVEAVRAIGNLKYDVRAAKASRVAELIREAAAGRPIVVAGSTVSSKPMDDEGSQDEENFLIQAWEQSPRQNLEALLVLAPRHPERFGLVEAVVLEFCYLRASDWSHAFADAASKAVIAYGYKAPNFLPGKEGRLDVILLNTIGDLAAVYGVADVAFVGGSLVRRGGHNPLEPAQFGVPVVMGASFENFRDVVGKMIAEDGIRIVQDKDELETALVELLTDGEKARAMGERGRRVFEEQQGATGRAVAALVGMVRP